jgi:hypothetical protein
MLPGWKRESISRSQQCGIQCEAEPRTQLSAHLNGLDVPERGEGWPCSTCDLVRTFLPAVASPHLSSVSQHLKEVSAPSQPRFRMRVLQPALEWPTNKRISVSSEIDPLVTTASAIPPWGYRAVYPPSMRSSAPFTKPDSSLARYRAPAAISSG